MYFLGGYDITTAFSLFRLCWLVCFASWLPCGKPFSATDFYHNVCATQAQSNPILDTSETMCQISFLPMCWCVSSISPSIGQLSNGPTGVHSQASLLGRAPRVKLLGIVIITLTMVDGVPGSLHHGDSLPPNALSWCYLYLEERRPA